MSYNFTRAIVIGGSIAGLTSARVLADHCEQVIILERDSLSTKIEPRKGAPQSRHPHLLLKRGELILEQLFPGLVEELIQAGAIKINWGTEVLSLAFGKWRPHYRSGLNTISCSRALLESTIRRHLSANPRIHFMPQTEVTALVMGSDLKRITGVQVRNRSNGAAIETPLLAELVVDASGRNSCAPAWLAALGYTPPRETLLESRPNYATRLYRRPPGFSADWKVVYMQPSPVATGKRRGGIIVPLEGGEQWHVTLIGMDEDYVPTTEDGFLEFASSLPDEVIYTVMKEAEPLTRIYGFRQTENRLRHYDQLPRRPEGFLVVGDAVCAFNPVFAQGMSVVAMSALVLEGCLQEIGAGAVARGQLSERFQQRLASLIDLPWQMATGGNFLQSQFGEETADVKLSQQYLKQLVRTSATNPVVLEAFYEVMQLVEEPTIFFRREVVLEVFNQLSGF